MSTATPELVAAPVRAPAIPRPLVELKGVSKSYGSGNARHEVLVDVNFGIRRGEFLSVCGFSGSGKTTLAHLIAGLVAPDDGQVLMNGSVVQGPGPERGLVFQNYCLLPWMTVYGNVALSVNRAFSSWSKSERDGHIRRFVEMVGLSDAVDRHPHELSGGMRQRVALARTLAMKPEVLLLDEPLSALDALTRSGLQEQILKIWEEERQTCLMITNDIDEALLMSDRIVPLNPSPRASLGPDFEVDLGRPRDKTALNHNHRFKELRNAVTSYLMAMRQESRDAEAAHSGGATMELPEIEPRLRKLPRVSFLTPGFAASA